MSSGIENVRERLRSAEMKTGTMGPPKLGFIAVVLLGTLLALWLRTGFAAQIIAGAQADDALFIKLARHLLSGEWLGSFDNVTLVKGPGYPIFIALAFVSGLSLKLAETLVYAGVCTVTAILSARLSKSYMLGSIVFLVTVLNPILLSVGLTRVIREGIYISLSLGAIVLPALILFCWLRSQRVALMLALVTGIVWAWFWLTREEGIWLLPSLSFLIVGSAYGIGRLSGVRFFEVLRSLSAPFGLALGTAVLLVAGVASINALRYGRFQVVEVNATPFERAYGAIYRINPRQRVRYVVFPADVRERLYRVSPSARELRPAFEGAIGEMWRRIGCEQMQLRVCPEILSGWFQWALRDAAAAAGHYRSAATAAAFYNRLADEIDAACTDQRLHCSSSRVALSPPFEPVFITDALSRVGPLVKTYWRDGLRPHRPDPSAMYPGTPLTDTEMAWLERLEDTIGASQPTAFEAGGSRQASAIRSEGLWKIADLVSKIYIPILAFMLLLSPIGLVVLFRRIRTIDDLIMVNVCIACGIGVMARVALLCYLDVTAIPSINSLYLSPASPLLIVGAVMTTVGGAIRIRNPVFARSSDGVSR